LNFINSSPVTKPPQRLTNTIVLTLIASTIGTNRPIAVKVREVWVAVGSPLDRSLPSIEEIEAELSRDLEGEL